MLNGRRRVQINLLWKTVVITMLVAERCSKKCKGGQKRVSVRSFQNILHAQVYSAQEIIRLQVSPKLLSTATDVKQNPTPPKKPLAPNFSLRNLRVEKVAGLSGNSCAQN